MGRLGDGVAHGVQAIGRTGAVTRGGDVQQPIPERLGFEAAEFGMKVLNNPPGSTAPSPEFCRPSGACGQQASNQFSVCTLIGRARRARRSTARSLTTNQLTGVGGIGLGAESPHGEPETNEFEIQRLTSAHRGPGRLHNPERRLHSRERRRCRRDRRLRRYGRRDRWIGG